MGTQPEPEEEEQPECEVTKKEITLPAGYVNARSEGPVCMTLYRGEDDGANVIHHEVSRTMTHRLMVHCNTLLTPIDDVQVAPRDHQPEVPAPAARPEADRRGLGRDKPDGTLEKQLLNMIGNLV